MKRYLMVFMMLILSASMFSCGSSDVEQSSFLPHIGKWVHEDAGGNGAKVIFNQDGSGSLRFGEGLYSFEYYFDYSKKPVTVDLVYSREGRPYRAKVIVKFLDINNLKWRTFFNDKRPEGFPEKDNKNTIILKRSGTQKGTYV